MTVVVRDMVVVRKHTPCNLYDQRQNAPRRNGVFSTRYGLGRLNLVDLINSYS